MPMYDYKYLLHDDKIIGQAADEYSTNEVDFGVATPNVNAKGDFGLHVVVTTLFAGCASGVTFWIIHGAATAPTTKHTGMFVPVAEMVAGANFFIPCGSVELLQFARMLFDEAEVSTAGKLTAFFGPKHGRET